MEKKTFSLAYGGSFDDLARQIDEWMETTKPKDADTICTFIEEDGKLVRLDYTIFYE